MATPARRGRPAGKPTAAPARKAQAPARGRPARATPDVTEFANRPATPYHKALAKWLVSEVGYDVNSASPKAAFLAGIRLAATARTAFNASDAAEEFYATSGESKRGPKPKAETEEAPPARKPAGRRPKPAPEPEPEPEEEDWDDEEADDDEESEEFEDDTEESDDEDGDDDDEWEDEEPEEAPAPAPKRAPARKAAPAPAKRAPAKAAPAKRAPAKAKPAADDDDDFIF